MVGYVIYLINIIILMFINHWKTFKNSFHGCKKVPIFLFVLFFWENKFKNII